jgi:protein-S-isoprenylcysteine O-methyltransferase Ste14
MTRFERVFVWAGGALFVTSLAVCLYSYLVVWGRPSFELHDKNAIGWSIPLGAIVTDLLLVMQFAVHHSVFAREQVKATVAGVIPERLLRSFYVWVASVLLIFVFMFWAPVGGDLYHATGWRALPFGAAQLTGLWVIVQAVRGIDPLELAGIRRETARGPLQVGGAYALVRHPLYFGWVLAVFGTAHMTGDRLVFAAITTLYLVIAIPWEERSLARSFGEDYARYAREVRWRMIPFIY